MSLSNPNLIAYIEQYGESKVVSMLDDLFDAGTPTKTIARNIGCSPTSIINFAAKHGLKTAAERGYNTKKGSHHRRNKREPTGAERELICREMAQMRSLINAGTYSISTECPVCGKAFWISNRGTWAYKYESTRHVAYYNTYTCSQRAKAMHAEMVKNRFHNELINEAQKGTAAINASTTAN